MASTIINELIEERANVFVSAFNQRAKVLFRDDEKRNKLRHPGEFGVYRENITAQFLKCFLPQHLAVETGFIVNAAGDVSGQIDLVIYNPLLTPPLESRERQRFFPVETVIAVGEVRSDVTKTLLENALQRLAKVKSFRARSGPEASAVSRWYGLSNTQYDPRRIPFDQMFTFLVCKRFTFDFQTSFPSILNDIYSDVDYDRRHNAILSLDDGLLQYVGRLPDGDMADAYFPTSPGDGARFQNKWIRNDGNRYAPIKLFGSSLFMHACHCTVGYADLNKYQMVGRHHHWTERVKDTA